MGGVHTPHWPSSSLHSNVAPSSSAENPNEASVSRVRFGGPAPIVVSGAMVSAPGAANVMTSCGWFSPFSRLLNCCSASAFSAASRTRKP
jgi:hypothetical protein